MKWDPRHVRKASLETHDVSKQLLRKCIIVWKSPLQRLDESAIYSAHVMLSILCGCLSPAQEVRDVVCFKGSFSCVPVILLHRASLSDPKPRESPSAYT